MDDLKKQIIDFLDAVISNTLVGKIKWEDIADPDTCEHADAVKKFLHVDKLYRFFISEEMPVKYEGREIKKKLCVVKKSVLPSAQCISSQNAQEYPYVFLGTDDGRIAAVIDIAMIDFSARLQALYESIDESLFPKESQFAAFQNGLDITDASTPKRDTCPKNS